MKNGIRSQKQNRSLRWLWIWLIQLMSLLGFAMLVSLTLALGKIVHGVCLWGLMPLAGAVSAALATVKGLNNYAAWIAPPLMLLLGYFLVWKVPAPVGPVFLCGFVALVGAATGQVLKTTSRK